MSTPLETITETIVTLQEQFDPNDFAIKKPACIKTVGRGIHRDRFPQRILTSKIQTKIKFLDLQKNNDHLHIELLALRLMDEPMIALRAIFNLMEAKDPVLNDIQGKRLIIPKKHGLEWIIFEPVGREELLWDIIDCPKENLNADGAVLAVLQS